MSWVSRGRGPLKNRASTLKALWTFVFDGWNGIEQLSPTTWSSTIFCNKHLFVYRDDFYNPITYLFSHFRTITIEPLRRIPHTQKFVGMEELDSTMYSIRNKSQLEQTLNFLKLDYSTRKVTRMQKKNYASLGFG